MECIDISSPLTLHRDALCRAIDGKLREHNVVLFRSPPQSGKTSLGVLLADWVLRTYKNVQPLWLTLLRVRRGVDPSSCGPIIVRLAQQ